LQKQGNPAKFGDDFGGDEETIISKEFDRPVLIHHYPSAMKAFYMQPDAQRPELALAFDMIAPEGYGEIIGGSQRIHDYDLLLKRLREHNLPEEAFQWYLDLRRYGSVPHSGFGMGLERTVAWICGTEHIREVIPFPRMIYGYTLSFSWGETTMAQKVRIIGVPMDLGQSRRASIWPFGASWRGAANQHQEAGLQVEDIGNLSVKQPEEMPIGEKRAKYMQEIAETCGDVAAAAEKALSEGFLPLVLAVITP